MRSMGLFDFEGRQVPFEQGDTIASALFRAGVRTFTRSLKYHRRRGLYCLSGDCPNCLCNVDGEPGVRSCSTPARDGVKVERETGWPGTERDLLGASDIASHSVMPVGFYYKTFTRPRSAWPLVEKVIRSTTGVGRLPVGRTPDIKDTSYLHPDVLVAGGGVAGLAASIAAAKKGDSVVLCEEGTLGEKIAPGPALERIRALEAELREMENATVLERHTVVGIYDGPMVPVAGPNIILQTEPARIVVATGAVESHAVFPGNDIPGVWLGRGSARMAGVHGVRPGARAVVAIHTDEGIEHLSTLRRCGVEIVAAVVPADLAPRVPEGTPVLRDGKVIAAVGRKQVRAVRVNLPLGERRIDCDVLVLSLGFSPRDALLRMTMRGEPVVGAGDVVLPGCSLDEAVKSGTEAGKDSISRTREAAREVDPPPMGAAGFVCLCEDVGVGDLHQAWSEGWNSAEILKRYTTATMGPCQGAMCGRHLAAFAKPGAVSTSQGGLTTARPPVRGVRLEDLAGAVHEIVEKRTALHDTHVRMGARMDWSGAWKRPFHYGDVADEYRAVRQRVSLMDVGTLGKTLVAGRDAKTLMDQVFPCRIEDLEPGRNRYMVTLDEAGYLVDDGLICALEGERYYITSTSGGSDRMEALLRNWTDRWGLHVHLVNQTAMLGAINVAGPHARDLLAALSKDPFDSRSFPYPAHREVTVAGVPCRAIGVGFVGELSYELHHPRSRSVELWDALMGAGKEFDIRPHGLGALETLRMEKGHFFLAQDTLPDDHPAKLGLNWAVDMNKPSFVGKVALERMAEIPVERKLIGLEFDSLPRRGVPLYAGDRIVGRVTSCAFSGVLGKAIGLGWLRAVAGEFPSVLRADDRTARVVPRPFYDPEGARLRG